MSRPPTNVSLSALIADAERARADFEAARESKFMHMGAYNHRGNFMQSQQTANLAAQDWQRAKDALVLFILDHKALIGLEGEGNNQ